MFFATRFLFELVTPFVGALVFAVLAFVAHLCKRRRVGNLLLLTSLVIFIFFGYGIGVRDNIAARESRYPPLHLEVLAETGLAQRVEFIVVLGSGHVSDPRLPANSQIGGASLFRLIEGIRLLQICERASLVVSGGPGYDQIANAEVVRQVALAVGVAPERVVMEKRPKNTTQEAEVLAPLLGQEDFILVTSALHMDRAMDIFTTMGMHPVPAPTDYIIKKGGGQSPGTVLPSTGNLDLARRLMYEWIGKQWNSIQRIIKNSP